MATGVSTIQLIRLMKELSQGYDEPKVQGVTSGETG